MSMKYKASLAVAYMNVHIYAERDKIVKGSQTFKDFCKWYGVYELSDYNV